MTEQELPGMVGRHPLMLEAYRLARLAASVDEPTLIVGETGTGKELVARAIHQLSAHRDGQFVDINCAALPEAIAEAELFGTEPGAFTGAVARPGFVSVADGGTLFLDEACSAPLPLQAKLLRVVESGTNRRVGARHSTPTRFRLVCAVSRPPEELVREGLMRTDLWYRLDGGFAIRLPPLRDRRSDIPLLVSAILAASGASPNDITRSAMESLVEHDWPGNVRQLRSVVRRCVRLGADGAIDAGLVADQLGRREWGTRPALEKLLARFGGRVSRVAEHLGVARSTVYARMSSLGMDAPKPERRLKRV